MKKKPVRITNPDELNENLSYSSPATWITLSAAILVLIGFFVWTLVYNIQIKVFGTANITGGVAVLHVDEAKLSSLKEGQKVYINGLEGQILSFDNDHQPVVSSFSLGDGSYDYYVVVKEMKPIEFWFNN